MNSCWFAIYSRLWTTGECVSKIAQCWCLTRLRGLWGTTNHAEAAIFLLVRKRCTGPHKLSLPSLRLLVLPLLSQSQDIPASRLSLLQNRPSFPRNRRVNHLAIKRPRSSASSVSFLVRNYDSASPSDFLLSRTIHALNSPHLAGVDALFTIEAQVPPCLAFLF